MKRIKSLATALMALAAFLLFAPNAANAQTTNTDALPEFAKDWQLRMGAFIASSSAARTAIGSVGFSGHVEKKVYQTESYDLFVGMGYNGMDSVYSVPILINLVYHNGNLRYGAGFGYSFGKRIDGRGMSGTALSLIAGYKLRGGSNPMNVDLRYLFISGASNELDGLSVTLGISF